jgi:hypothetical protein
MFSPPQSRHPERSAEQIYRIRDALWREVEGPRRRFLADILPSFPAANRIKEATSSEEAHGSAVPQPSSENVVEPTHTAKIITPFTSYSHTE